MPYASYMEDACSNVFVCWAWNFVLHAKEIEEALPSAAEMPAGFEEAMREIQRDAVIGL